MLSLNNGLGTHINMLMSCLLLFFALLLGPFVIQQLMDWAKKRRLARQHPSAQEETNFKKMVEESAGEADNLTREDSHVPVTLMDTDLLECPICCEPLKIPIFQCTNGHLACSMCCEKINNVCPFCKLPIGYNRCRAMEKVIETYRMSCPNAKYGCKENLSYQNRSSHEKLCVFAPCSCPFRDCNYTASHKDLKNHVTAKHKGGLFRFTFGTPLNVRLTEKTSIFRDETDGELIVVQGFKRSEGAFVSVSSITPFAPETGVFSCSLELKTLRNTLKHRLIMKKVQKMSEECPKEDFVLIPSYILRRGFTMNICITRCMAHRA